MKLTFIKEHPAIFYFVLVFAISWGLILILAGPGKMPIDPERSKNLLPLLYTMMLIGPGTAGVFLIGLTYGRTGFRKYMAQLTRWRVGLHWYFIALTGTPALSTLVLIILSSLSPEFNNVIFESADKTNIIITGILVGLFEETGWSGYIVPKLRLLYSTAITGLIT